jgi:prepilin-type processing-associated H-X9-DG protein
MNGFIADPADRIWVGGALRKLGVPLSKAKRAADHIMIFEEIAPNDAWCYPMDVGSWAPRADDLFTGRHGGRKFLNAPRSTANGSPAWESYKNNGRGNHAFFDGHVEALTPNQIYNKHTLFGPLEE